MSNWTRDPETIYPSAPWIISSRIINNTNLELSLSSPWALLLSSFFVGFEAIDFPSEMVTSKVQPWFLPLFGRRCSSKRPWIQFMVLIQQDCSISLDLQPSSIVVLRWPCSWGFSLEELNIWRCALWAIFNKDSTKVVTIYQMVLVRSWP
jgi:hypothetical protein